MPTVTLNKNVVEKLIGKKLPIEKLKDRISMLGTDLEKIEGNEIVDGSINYEAANSSKLEDYVRVDISGQYKLKFSEKVKGSIGVSVWNLLNAETITNTYYKLGEDGSVQQVDQISLGLTPNVSFRVYF